MLKPLILTAGLLGFAGFLVYELMTVIAPITARLQSIPGN